ncbi:hypothetical protein LJR221_004728 [Agrobacterium tumefaciens]|nr:MULTISPECIES: hypothetical protein [Agrobacterium]MDA5246735.1 hypothetical protein [Agrobacterium sp. MAFF210268]
MGSVIRRRSQPVDSYSATAPLALTAILAASTVALALLQALSVMPDA